MSDLVIFRGVDQLHTVQIDEETVYQNEFMGADKVIARFISHTKLDIAVNDYIQHKLDNYYLKDAPEVSKTNSLTFEYELTFYGPGYELYNKLIIDEGRTQFSYTGTPFDLISLILDNIQTLDPGWSLGSISNIAEVKTFSFNEQSCRIALTQVAEAFDLEYFILNKTIHLIESVGQDTNHLFQYGRGKGLYELTRRVLDEPFATRWYGFGGQQNIPTTYRNALGRLTTNNSPYDSNTGVYGIIESSVTFEDVYPRFEGTVEAVDGNNKVTDSNIDFNLNELFISEGAAKIVFKTGDLAGNEFVITSYSNAAKQVTFGQTEDNSGYILPNDTVNPAVGDAFTFVGIEMPQSYIDNAELELEAKVQEHIAKESNPKVGYDLSVDEKFMKNNAISLVVGDRVRVTDSDLSVDELIRVQSIEYPLVNTNKVTVVLSDDLVFTDQERIVRDIRENELILSDTIEDAVYGRKVADEIRNYALVTQFAKTLVGELAVMSGAFVAGNPSQGAVAGINGSGTEDTEVRFYAGSDHDNRDTAPFRVQQNGKAIMSALEVLAGSILQGGVQIGTLLIDDEGYLRSGDYDPTTNEEGVKLDSDGIVAAGGGIDYDATYTGNKTILGSLFGVIKQLNDASQQFAAIVGLNIDELDATHSAQLQDVNKSYGGLFSSIKNVGAESNAIIFEGGLGSDVFLQDEYRYVIIEGSTRDVYLPPNPDRGFTIEIRMKGTNPPLKPRAGDTIEGASSFSVGADNSVKMGFIKATRTWYYFPGR